MVERAASRGALLVPMAEGHARRLLARAMDLAACLQPDDLAYDTELTTWSGRGPGTPDGVLTATSLGLATCPLSQPLEIADTRALIRDEVLDGAARPHLILRPGRVYELAEGGQPERGYV